MLATCLIGSLLDQLSCTIVNLFTCTFGRINMSVCLSVFCHFVFFHVPPDDVYPSFIASSLSLHLHIHHRFIGQTWCPPLPSL